MSAPDQASQLALQRLTRYLQGSPRLVYSFLWQPESDLDVFVDTDFAGCMATRRSTSGGVAVRGTHLIKHWSCTQRAVTLSSAEAELYGLVKGTTEALGIQSWGLDLGLTMNVRIHADSAAAIGICRRSGIGRVRHLAVAQLWVQEGLRRGDFTLWKVQGEQNPADILTKCVSREILDRHLKMLSLHRVDGRAATAPLAQLHGGEEVRPIAAQLASPTVPSIVQPTAAAQTLIPGALPLLLNSCNQTGHLPDGPAIAAKPGRWYTLSNLVQRCLGWHQFH